MFRRALIAVALAACCGGVAAAHAVLLGTEPLAGARLATSPQRIVLRFGEAVETGLGAIRILDAHGREQPAGPIVHPGGDGRAIAVDLAGPLERGAYTVAWNVISADSHPVGGAFTFGVGVAPESAPAAVPGDPLAAGARAVLRAVVLGGLLLGIGLPLGALVAGRGAAAARPQAAEWAAWLVVAAGSFADLATRAALAGGTVTAAVATRFGSLRLLEAVGAAIAAAALTGTTRNRTLLLAAALLAAGAQSAAGHAATHGPLLVGVGADALHLLAAAAWTGALAAALGYVEADLGRVSALATVAVAVLGATAAAGAMRMLGSPADLLTSLYGRLLTAKLALFAAGIALGWRSRRRLARGTALAGSVRLELAGILVVVGVTAVLLDAVPPAPGPATAHLRVAGVGVDVRVEAQGPARWRLTLHSSGPDGRPRDLAEAAATLRAPASGVAGPLPLAALRRLGAGDYVEEVTLPFAATWMLDVRARVGDLDEETVTLTLPEEPS